MAVRNVPGLVWLILFFNLGVVLVIFFYAITGPDQLAADAAGSGGAAGNPLSFFPYAILLFGNGILAVLLIVTGGGRTKRSCENCGRRIRQRLCICGYDTVMKRMADDWKRPGGS